MGYRKIPKIHTLEFDGDLQGLVVRARSIKFGKVRSLLALMDEDDKDVEVMGQITKELAGALVSWNLEDEDGTPVELSSEAIDDLEFEEVMAIVNKWLDALTGPGKDLGKDSNSGGNFPGRPLTMEAL